MTKVKSGAKAMDRSPIAHLKAVKNNSIQKKKNNKFANTPTGKIRLVNGKKAQNNDKIKNKLNIKEKEKPQIKDSPDSPDSNKSSPRSNDKKNSPKEILNVTKALNSPNKQSGKNKKKYIKNLVDKEDESDESLEDINEGVVLPDDSIISQDDNDDDDDETNEEESDIDLPNILGQSLADDTDEDDSDFDEEEDDEDDHDHDSDEDGVSQLKGVKMFKGLLKQKLDSVKKNENEKENDEDEDEEDDDMDESNLEIDTSMSSGRNKNKKGNISTTEDEEESDEDNEEDEEEDEDDEDDESTPGLKDLLGNSIADDENDEDFEGEDEDDEDIDISDEESEADADESNVEQRTIYVGNVPKDSTKQEIKKVFKEFGSIKSIRIRNVAPPNVKVSKKVAAITKQIHQDIDHVSMLIVFQNAESASKALCMNGKKFKGHYLRVDTTEKVKTQPDPKKAVFLGNLPFTINDNSIWEHFGQCGEIDFVRLIRDKKTRIGKGIGYVNFKNEDSVPLALELDGSTLLNREIRVKRHFEKGSGSKSEQTTKNKRNKRLHPAGSRVKKSPKKLKVNDEEVKTTSPATGGTKKLKAKGKSQENSSPSSEKKKTVFQGQKAATGKKTKKSKLDKKKKKIAAVLTAKPKKVQKV